MLSFFYMKRTNQEIVSSKLFDEATFYKAFERDVRKSKKSVVIESPFLTERRAHQFSSIIKKLRKRDVKVIIYTRYPYHHPYRLRIHALEGIKILQDAGARVYECRDFRHRKVAVIDKTKLWEGSLNILSQSKSRETMRRIESKMLARQMLGIIKS